MRRHEVATPLAPGPIPWTVSVQVRGRFYTVQVAQLLVVAAGEASRCVVAGSNIL